MRSLHIYDLLRHHEERQNVSKLQLMHPIVVVCQLAYIGLIILVYALFASKTPGQNFYFLITVGLSVSTAAYHTWKTEQDSFLRFIDQTMIGWYVHVLPMPLIYHESWALPLTLGLMAFTAISKWHRFEDKLADRITCLKPKHKHWVGAGAFFAFGALSFLLVITYGFNAIGADKLSWTGFWVVIATTCFIGKLYFYTSGKGKLVRNVWEAPESGHFMNNQGNNIWKTIVVLNPV